MRSDKSLEPGPRPSDDAGRAPRQRRSLLLAWTASAVAHLMVVAALFWPHANAPPPEAAPLLINLVEAPEPEPPNVPPGPPDMPQLQAGDPQFTTPAPTPVAAPVVVVEIETTPTPNMSDLLSESQLAGAAGVNDDAGGGAGGGGGGGGGGGCDTARIVQQALRRDPLVRTAVANADRLGKSVMLWNGDWVRAGDQDGKGLSAVREAVIWELAFAPEACRNKRVHGLVVLSLADGATRFAIGAADWRWSDLLGVRAALSAR